MSTPRPGSSSSGPDRRRRGPSWAVVLAVPVAVLVLALVHLLVATVVAVPSASMAPTVPAGARVLVQRAGAEEPARGDVVVADVRGTWLPPTGEPGVPDTVLKRVVGLPGERVSCCTDDGRLQIDGAALNEPYLGAVDAANPASTPFDVVVPGGRVWLMGDDRASSADSRDHLGSPGGGTVRTSSLQARAVALLWPLDRVGGLDERPTLDDAP